MFEGQIVPAAGDSAAEGGTLRAPAWSELVARLAAAHDYRRATAQAGVHPCGNFDRFADRNSTAPRHGERCVNPDGLGHGKGNGGMSAAAAKHAVTGDRETR